MEKNNVPDTPILEMIYDYIFHNLSKKNEEKLEHYFDENPDVNEFVMELMNLCNQYEIFDKQGLIRHFKLSKDRVNNALQSKLDLADIDESNATVNSDIPKSVSNFEKVALFKKLQPNRKRYAFAAIFVGVFLSCLFGIQQISNTISEKPSISHVLEENLKPYDPMNKPMAAALYDTIQYTQLLKKANNFYIKGEYTDALDIFNILKINYAQQDTLIFYSGLCYLLKKDSEPQRALNEFTLLLELKREKFKEPAEWYMAFCYLKLAETASSKDKRKAQLEKAKWLLEKMDKSTHYYGVDAKLILQQISTF